MRIKLIEAWSLEDSGGGKDYFLAPVAFPMTHMPEYTTRSGTAGETTLNNENELRQWAETNFAAYEIFVMEVPEAAMVTEEDE